MKYLQVSYRVLVVLVVALGLLVGPIDLQVVVNTTIVNMTVKI